MTFRHRADTTSWRKHGGMLLRQRLVLVQRLHREDAGAREARPNNYLQSPPAAASQRRLMAAAAHTKGGYGGVPQSVGKEFNAADTAKRKARSPGMRGRKRVSYTGA